MLKIKCRLIYKYYKYKQEVFAKYYPPTKSEKAIFSVKVKVKVTKSLNLVSIERASLVEYECKT